MSKGWVMVATALYYGKRHLTKMLLKTIVKGLLPRAMTKFVLADGGWFDAVLVAVIAAFWNYLTIRLIVREIIVCCLGPSTVTWFLQNLFHEWARVTATQDFPFGLKIPDVVIVLMMRAVGMSVTNNCLFHPNRRHMLNFI